MPASEKISSGVQQLIARLRDDGVAAGEQEAERLVERARKQAAQITADAKKQADELRAQARADIERESEAARSSVQLAVRDTLLTMRSEITARFQAQVKRLVTAELRDPETIRRLVLAIAGKSVPEEFATRSIEIEIAESMFGGEETKEARERTDQIVLRISAEMLREGVEIKPAGNDRPGIRVRLAGEDIEVDLSDEAISEALIAHLLPRYRSIVAGIQGAS